MIKNEKDFFVWLDGQLDGEIPSQVIAFNINIYESPFIIEIVGSNEFDPQDEDWACNENWVPKQRKISVSDSLFGASWQNAQVNLITMAKQYLQSDSKNAHKLKSAKAFAIGFINGNLSYV
jgi:hypothetical protein